MPDFLTDCDPGDMTHEHDWQLDTSAVLFLCHPDLYLWNCACGKTRRATLEDLADETST